jgi:hypothetical protein
LWICGLFVHSEASVIARSATADDGVWLHIGHTQAGIEYAV